MHECLTPWTWIKSRGCLSLHFKKEEEKKGISAESESIRQKCDHLIPDCSSIILSPAASLQTSYVRER